MSFKENEIRPKDLMELKIPALEHDIKYLQDRIPIFIKVDCPACNSNKHLFWAEKMRFNYHQCNDCETIFMNPRADENTLGDFYKQSKNYDFWNQYIFPTTDKIRKEKIFKPRAQKTITFCEKYDIKSGGVLVEIGAAFGTYCEAIQELNFFKEIIAVEPTPGLAKTCRDKGFNTLEETIENLTFPEGSADVIANFEVLEHLGNPIKFIELCAKYLKSGGLFICTCPNGLGLGTLVLKEKAKVVDHEHVNYFNPKSLSLLLERCGLETLEVLTPGELDVDLLVNDYNENSALFENNEFVKNILTSNEKVKNEFQTFLKNNLLSSHLWIIGKKK
jgi:2-polyprenyl-3-methyl-5-hydroxy-6-metoxy-1,4-benzoquinol methylase